MDCTNCIWYRRSDWIVLGKTTNAWGAGTTLTVNPAHYREPIQTCAWDCQLIAAISSVLWVNISLSLKLEKIGIPSIYSITFYDGGNSLKQVYVTDNLLCNPSNQLIWAYNQYNGSDIWPALFEKAFAAFCEDLSSSLSNPIDKPGWPCSDPAKPKFGSGFIDYNGAMNHRLVKYRLAKQDATLSNIYNLPFDATGKIMYPAIALTKANLSNPPANIASNHAYSVLSKNGTNLVLRNPKTDVIYTITQSVYNAYFSAYQYIVP